MSVIGSPTISLAALDEDCYACVVYFVVAHREYIQRLAVSIGWINTLSNAIKPTAVATDM